MEDELETQQTQETPDPAQEEDPTELETLRAQLDQARADALEAHRGRLLAEHAGQVVPQLVTGTTPEELAASIETAKAAYAAIADQVRASTPAASALPNVGQTSGTGGGGGGSTQAVAPPLENLSPMAKLQGYFATKNGKH